jgi:hypothetical protein
VKWFNQHLAHGRRSAHRPRTRLNLELLETRIVPYSTSGGSWPHSQLVTISFEPDGTDLGGVSSNLFATLNAHRGWTTSTWQTQILRAAQVWAQQTNVNFAVVSDSGTGVGGGNYQQGDPAIGDIRIGGYNFGTSDLAGASYPPPINNFSIAGDIVFNTGQAWNIGAAYDLFSVAMHEFGHALGLGESTATGSVMKAAYSLHTGLSSDDITGIRSLYSNGNPRSNDSYYGGLVPNNSFLTAADISLLINGSLTAVVNNLSISSTSEAEYFSFLVPLGSQSSFTVSVQSSGLSLLAPIMTIYNGLQTQIASASGAGQYGTTLNYTVTGASPLQLYYVKVAGADSSAFGTGAYALTLNFGTGPAPTVTPPNTQVPNGNPLVIGGGDPEGADDSSPRQFQAPASTLVQTTAVLAFVAGTPASTYSGQAPVTYSKAAPATVQASFTVAAPNLVIPSQPVADSRTESGGGQGDVPSAMDDFEADSPALLISDMSASTPGASVPADAVIESQAETFRWREAATATFAADTLARFSAPREQQPASDAQPTDPALNHAAGAVCMILTLGSYWHAVPEDSRAARRRPKKL